VCHACFGVVARVCVRVLGMCRAYFGMVACVCVSVFVCNMLDRELMVFGSGFRAEGSGLGFRVGIRRNPPGGAGVGLVDGAVGLVQGVDDLVQGVEGLVQGVDGLVQGAVGLVVGWMVWFKV